MGTLCDAADVVDKLGGLEAVNQLLDPNKTGSYDADMMAKCIADAEGDVEAAYGVRYHSITTNVSGKIRRLTSELAAAYAWRRGPRNLTMPPTVVDMLRDARAELARIETSASPGGTPQGRVVGIVDLSDGGRRTVPSVWRRGGLNGAR